ncbi:MAG: hypothetical protein ACK5ZR_02040 [Gemmatimonadaceae bacterium]
MAPFIACTFFRLEGAKNGAQVIRKLQHDGQFDFPNLLEVKDKAIGRRYRTKDSPVIDFAGAKGSWGTYYVERRLPSWVADARGTKEPPGTASLVDENHQLVVAVVRKQYLALVATEDLAREIIEERWLAWAETAGAKLRRVSRDEIQNAFAFKPAKTLWLKGLHVPTPRRPSAKMLIGSRLQHALNPLDDQTFTYSAARCAAGKGFTVGFAPTRGRLWVRAAKNWRDFVSVIEQLGELLANGRQHSDEDDEELSLVLAQPIRVDAEVKNPSGLAVADPLLLLPDGEEVDEFLREVAERAQFTVVPLSGAPAVAQKNVEFRVELDGETIATFRIEISTTGDATPTVSVRRTSPRLSDEDRQKAVDSLHRYLRRRGSFTIWYDSGHTFAEGQLFGTNHRSLQFRSWSWADFRGYPITEEKPTTPSSKVTGSGKPRRVYNPSAVGKAKASLFCWLVRERTAYLPDDEGWLLCDDGSLETADFVYFSPSRRQLSLIHAKGASNGHVTREVSVSDYEVVVSQALKNLHWTVPARLIARLNQRAASKMPPLVWRKKKGGLWKAASWPDFNLALSQSQLESRQVVVLQPSLRKSLYSSHKSASYGGTQPPAELIRLWQLDYLLLSAEASCRAFGAELVVVGDGVS